MEHRLIQGGEQYLPFARSRIKALLALGLPYADQSFDMGDAHVKVRIEPGHEYISIEGSGAYVYILLRFLGADVTKTRVYRLFNFNTAHAVLVHSEIDDSPRYEDKTYSETSSVTFHFESSPGHPVDSIQYVTSYLGYTVSTTGSLSCPSFIAAYGENLALAFSKGSSVLKQTYQWSLPSTGTYVAVGTYVHEQSTQVDTTTKVKYGTTSVEMQVKDSAGYITTYADTSFFWDGSFETNPLTTTEVDWSWNPVGDSVVEMVFLHAGSPSLTINDVHTSAVSRKIIKDGVLVSEDIPAGWKGLDGPVHQTASPGDKEWVEGQTTYIKRSRASVNFADQGIDFINYNFLQDASPPIDRAHSLYDRENILASPSFPIDDKTLVLSMDTCIKYTTLCEMTVGTYKDNVLTKSKTIDLRALPGLDQEFKDELPYTSNGLRTPHNLTVSTVGSLEVQICPDQKGLFQKNAKWFF